MNDLENTWRCPKHLSSTLAMHCINLWNYSIEAQATPKCDHIEKLSCRNFCMNCTFSKNENIGFVLDTTIIRGFIVYSYNV